MAMNRIVLAIVQTCWVKFLAMVIYSKWLVLCFLLLDELERLEDAIWLRGMDFVTTPKGTENRRRR